MSEEKTGIGKKILAVVVALITISVTITILRFIVPVVGALTLGLFDIHVSESEEALRNLEAFSNIFNLAVALYVGWKVYKRMTRLKDSNGSTATT